jgi:hypothetical protein
MDIVRNELKQGKMTKDEAMYKIDEFKLYLISKRNEIWREPESSYGRYLKR